MKIFCLLKKTTVQLKEKAGFTFIELLVVVLLMGVLTSMGVASYNQFNEKREVEKAAEEFKSNLRLIQSKAINNEKASSCGNQVLIGWYLEYLNSSSYKFYGQCAAISFNSQTINLEKAVFDHSFPLIQFKPLGGTNLTSEVVIAFNDGLETVTISKSGDIY